MNKALQSTKQEFQSSCVKTPEYLSWHRLFKKEFSKFLITLGATTAKIGKPNHFDMSGFFTINGQDWYFRIEDVRWSKETMLLRTVKSYADYTGWRNHSVPLKNEVEFASAFRNIIHDKSCQMVLA